MDNIQEVAKDDVRFEPEPPKKPELVLTDEQQLAIEAILEWAKNPRPDLAEFKLGGYAGTGKTTIIRVAREKLREKYGVVVASFTGKAVDVLTRKGIPAQTLHSLMYDCIPIGKGRVRFERRTRLREEPDVIIVDEASMVSTELYNDLKSYGLKYLFVGDPGQLEPVGDNPNLMKDPHYVLSKIHRQAAESPIITLANSVRNGSRIYPQAFPNPDSPLLIRAKGVISFGEVNQVICARNNTRRNVNQKARAILNHISQGPLVKGEKIIVLRNNRDFGVFNGMILFVKEIIDAQPEYWEIAAVDEIGREYPDLLIWRVPFEDPTFNAKEPQIPKVPTDPKKPYGEKVALVYADYGYCITCHKSQGSEWEHVLVLDEWMPPTVWDMKRWRYTAITRAAKKLTYCI